MGIFRWWCALCFHWDFCLNYDKSRSRRTIPHVPLVWYFSDSLSHHAYSACQMPSVVACCLLLAGFVSAGLLMVKLNTTTAAADECHAVKCHARFISKISCCPPASRHFALHLPSLILFSLFTICSPGLAHAAAGHDKLVLWPADYRGRLCSSTSVADVIHRSHLFRHA